MAAALAHLQPLHPLARAPPRGGLPVGYKVARHLGTDLELLLVCKIGLPGYGGYGIGAVVDGNDPHVFFNEGLICAAAPGYPETIVHAANGEA